MKRFLPVLALSLLLCACAPKAEQAAPQSSPDTTTLLIIDGREIPAWRYLCWLERECAAAQTAQKGFSGEAAAQLKDRALLDTALCAAVEAMAEHCGISPAEDAPAPSAFSSLPPLRAQELAAVGDLYAKLCRLAATPGSALAPDGETIAAFAQQQGYLTLDRILIPPGEGAPQRAAELFAAINSGGTAAFDSAKSQSADTAGKRTFRIGDSTLSPTLEEAAAVLEEGHFSGILETAEGYSILLRLPTELTDIALPWLDHRLLDAAEKAVVQTTAEYETLDVNGFYQNTLHEEYETPSPLSSP